jgi:hypothetical protein
MQTIELSKYPNSSGWAVHHDTQGSQLYVIKNSNGNTKAGKYTKRKSAEIALQGHLEKIKNTTVSKGRPTDKARKAAKAQKD